MPETLLEYDDPLRDPDGGVWHARACGEVRLDGLWEAWLEFARDDGGAAVRTPRETTQPNRTDAAYWATGITPVYLEGAFDRAIARR